MTKGGKQSIPALLRLKTLLVALYIKHFCMLVIAKMLYFETIRGISYQSPEIPLVTPTGND